MKPVESDRNNITQRLKENKSMGNLILFNKKRYIKLKEKHHSKLIEALTNLNKSLKKSESLVNFPFSIKKNNSVMKIFKLKEEKINRKISKYNILPDIKKDKKNDKPELNNKDNLKNRFSSEIYFNFNLKDNFPTIQTNKTEEKIPYYLRALKLSTKTRTPAQIVKISQNSIHRKNPFNKYCFNLEEKIGDYVENKDNNTRYTNFHNLLKEYIKDELTGISVPGNILSRAGFIKTIQPKNVRTKIKKNIDVPNHTLIPTPSELAGKGINFTHITMKDIYNEKNKVI